MPFQFDIATVVLSENDADGHLGLQHDAYGEAQAGTTPYECHSPAGLLSRPRDPDVDASGTPTDGANVLIAMEGSEGHAFPLSDPRAIARLPQTKKGGTVVYADTGATGKPAFQAFDGDNGSWQLYVGYGATAMTIAVDVSTPGAENIQIRHGDGTGISISTGAKHSVVINNKAGDGYVEVNDDGVTINGNIQINGGVVLGSIAGAQPLAVFPTLAAWAAQVNAALASLNGQGGATGAPIVVVPPSGAPTPTLMVSGT